MVVVIQIHPTRMQINANNHSGCKLGGKQIWGLLYTVIQLHSNPSLVSPEIKKQISKPLWIWLTIISLLSEVLKVKPYAKLDGDWKLTHKFNMLFLFTKEIFDQINCLSTLTLQKMEVPLCCGIWNDGFTGFVFNLSPN